MYKKDTLEHRGRLQAQGENLESSEAWSQDEPLSKQEGLNLLDKLRNKIPKKEAEIREVAFQKAERFIENGPYLVVTKIISKSYKVPDTEHERVDVEIQKGTAFV